MEGNKGGREITQQPSDGRVIVLNTSQEEKLSMGGNATANWYIRPDRVFQLMYDGNLLQEPIDVYDGF